ncbi:MAG: LysE family translocator [Formivibrio sp.]|nr:LysE family translocator [Formivibrio sp.]
MSHFQLFLLLAGTHFLALLSPGPDFFLVLRTSTRFGSRAGVLTSAGIALANALYVVCALSGVALMQRVPLLLEAIRWLGCGYLAWLGWRILRSSNSAPLYEGVTALPPPGGSVFMAGLLSGLLNPKNALFYFSLLSVATPRDTPLAWRLLYGVWMVSVVFGWDALLALGVGNSTMRRCLLRQLALVEKVLGCVFLVIAGGMLATGVAGK